MSPFSPFIPEGFFIFIMVVCPGIRKGSPLLYKNREKAALG
jgi:hypothetical protein